jgi:hypothetical protein
MGDFWGVVISVQLFAVMVQNLYRIVIDWGKPHPITTSELLFLLDKLGISTDKAVKAIKESNLDVKNFIVEEIRKKDKREFDKALNKKRGGKNNE